LKLTVFNFYFFRFSYSVVLFYLFLNAVLLRASAEKFSRGRDKHQDREIAPISLPPFYQWRVRGRTGHAPKAHLKGTLHQEHRVKVKIFLWRNPISGKIPIFLEDFSPISCEKIWLRSSLGLNHPCIYLNVDRRSKELRMVSEKVDCFYNTSSWWKI